VPGPSPTPPGVTQATRISVDPFSNASSQHATEVEPSAASFGSTIVAAFQSGRFVDFGSSDNTFATSRDGGHTWSSGTLPGTTRIVSGSSIIDSVSDPVVGYDAAHGYWLIASIPVELTGSPVPTVFISRSTDGLTWSNPVVAGSTPSQSDKNWFACDNTPSSPFYGHCYLEWDDANSNVIYMQTSTDGGASWSVAQTPGGNPAGIGGQPVVQTNGTVIVPIDDDNEANILAFTSHDGGATWSAPVAVAHIVDHFDGGQIRSNPLPSGTIDANGTVYLSWQDCRFRTSCATNDIVFVTSSNGVSWSAPVRVPLDTVSSSADHFIPGLAADPARSGHLGLTYYYYPDTNCTAATCQLYSAYSESNDGGATWSAPINLSGPMNLSSLAQTTQGRMVGDYIATTFSGGQACSVFAFANARTSAFDEAMYAALTPPSAARAALRRSSSLDRPIPGAASDHPPRPHLPP
jgi:hypothetical protein